jgi:hypothetical protein
MNRGIELATHLSCNRPTGRKIPKKEDIHDQPKEGKPWSTARGSRPPVGDGRALHVRVYFS